MAKCKVIVDPELCIGAASCVTVFPAVFSLNEENKAVVTDPTDADRLPTTTSATYERILELTDEQKETLILAAQSCPTLAISIFDEKGEKIFPE